MVLVFGGTTEGKKVMECLERRQQPFIYSTKTKVEVEESAYMKYHSGALDQDCMDAFIHENKISMIIDAAHPFAEILHQTIASVALKNELPVIRFGRKPIQLEGENGILWAEDYKDAEALLFDQFQGKKLLALTGVQTIEKFEKWWKQHPSIFRILPRESSKKIAEKAGFPKEDLILSMPNQEQELEESLIKEKGIDVVMTKESGASGFLQTKIDASQTCGIPIIIIREPKVPASFQVVYTVQELENKLGQNGFE
ncbi:precorrin-6A reductase [Flammeovirga sp. EKP202]|uniref:precorrin-6A reductase n=1 Tax=Flammeovirga sp. EKP202 TaxID=2770592 RepID=UPI00165F9073|nr:precorrin-6A reductase [Flammeovirga sp. EKP202]MBD0402593.1 precorrin-6A reductase [Flammeovirga sp. EKP202]